MGNLNDENTNTFSGVGIGATSGTVAVDTDYGGDSVTAFIDDGSENAPADFTIIAERYSDLEDRWMEYGRTSVTGAANPQSITDESVPREMRYKIQNDSGGSADFRISVVSY